MKHHHGIVLWHADGIADRLKNVKAEIDGEWHAARPLGYDSFWFRLKCAWRVFRRELDVLEWYKQ